MWMFWALLSLPAAVALLALFAPKEGGKEIQADEKKTRIHICYTGTPVRYWNATVLYDAWGQPWIEGRMGDGYPACRDYLLRENGRLVTNGPVILWKRVSGPEIKFPAKPDDPFAIANNRERA